LVEVYINLILISKYCTTTASTRTGNSAALHCRPVMRGVMKKKYGTDSHSYGIERIYGGRR
jgi:hypothetical protein